MLQWERFQKKMWFYLFAFSIYFNLLVSALSVLLMIIIFYKSSYSTLIDPNVFEAPVDILTYIFFIFCLHPWRQFFRSWNFNVSNSSFYRLCRRFYALFSSAYWLFPCILCIHISISVRLVQCFLLSFLLNSKVPHIESYLL